MNKAFEDHLDKVTPGRLEELNVPGVAFALIENGAIKAIKTYGFADKAKGSVVTGDTVFNIASISKSFTSWGVMKLVEQGKIDLDTPVEEYLSSWMLPESEFDHSLVTLRRLLSHTAGVSTEGVKGIDPGLPEVDVLDVLNGNLPPLDPVQLAYVKQWQPEVDPGRQRDPASITHNPGESHQYSNLGLAIVELLIEEVSGLGFAEFMREQVLDPLGMTVSGFEGSPPNPENYACPHNDLGEALTNYRLVAKAASSMRCTIGELATFACAELSGPKGEPLGRNVITPKSLQTLFSKVIFAETIRGVDFDAALGHMLIKINGANAVHHTGGVPGWRSIYLVIPEAGVGYVALINSDGGNPLWIQTMQEWAGSL